MLAFYLFYVDDVLRCYLEHLGLVRPITVNFVCFVVVVALRKSHVACIVFLMDNNRYWFLLCLVEPYTGE